MRAQVKPNWEYWPYPRMDEDSPIKVPVHVNHTYMMSTVAPENVDAAFEVLKWVSFGTQGNLAKMDIFAARPADETVDGKLYFLWYFLHPASRSGGEVRGKPIRYRGPAGGLC